MTGRHASRYSMFATVLLLGCLLGAPLVHSHNDTETVGHDFVADECLVCFNSVADDEDLDVYLALIADSFVASPSSPDTSHQDLTGLDKFLFSSRDPPRVLSSYRPSPR